MPERGAAIETAVERLQPDADVGSIVEIERASFTTPWTPDMFRWELRNSEVSSIWVLKTAGNRVAAFCCVWLVLDELHINNLAVAPAFRRQGFARLLLEHVMADAVCRGAMRATLEVRASNQAALYLYEQLGFSQGGLRRAYYADPVEDALVLWRTLVEPAPARLPQSG